MMGVIDLEVLVINYTHWVGYHIVEALLSEGYKVYGLVEETGNENLADFFVRNSSFYSIEKPREEKYELIISIGSENQQILSRANRIYFINQETANDDKNYLIQAPYLFGEWMPMDEQGFYYQEERIDFSSELFQSEGIYIDDFINLLINWLNNPPNLREIRLERKKNMGNQAVKLDKSFFVHENVPIGEKIRAVVTHYNKFHSLYPKLK